MLYGIGRQAQFPLTAVTPPSYNPPHFSRITFRNCRPCFALSKVVGN
jgi:hypothetical protein